MTETSANPESSQSATSSPELAGDQPALGSTKTNSRSSKSLAPRFGMLTLLLVAGLVCVWSAYVKFRSGNRQLEAEIEAIKQLATDLEIEDFTRMAIVRGRPSWYDETIWDIYLPPGQEYRIALATRDLLPSYVRPKPPIAKAAATAMIEPGTYALEFRKQKTDEGWTLQVLLDDKVILEHQESKDWHPGHGSSGGASFSRSEQPKDMAPVVLFNRRFSEATKKKNVYKTPDGPCRGIELRIEPVKKD